MNGKLRDRLLRLTYGDVVDWVGETVAARGFNYKDRVCEVFSLTDGYAAVICKCNAHLNS